MFKRVLSAVVVGGLLFAATIGFAASQEFSSGGVAAQGTAAAEACEASLAVQYVGGTSVSQVRVHQDGGTNCDGLPFHVSVQAEDDSELGSGSGLVNGAGASMSPPISDVAGIHHAVVTITNVAD